MEVAAWANARAAGVPLPAGAGLGEYDVVRAAAAFERAQPAGHNVRDFS